MEVAILAPCMCSAGGLSSVAYIELAGLESKLI